jgi:hypothetical protein
MVKIDGKDLVFSSTFMVGNNQEAEIEFPINEDKLKLSITFKATEAPGERNGEWKQVDGVVKFTFTGWSNPMGTCVAEPTKFGDIGGKRIYFQLANHYVGEQNLASLFILLGD